MTEDLNLHVEAIRALFKKRFIDILKGKDDVDKNFDWNVCEKDLDLFSEEISTYVAEKNIGEKDLIKLLEEFYKSNLWIDKRIGMEIDRLTDIQ